MDLDRFLDELQAQAGRLAASAGYVAGDTPVPSCPGWTVERTVGHLAKAHRWATWVVRGGALAGFDYQRPPAEELPAFLAAGTEELVTALREATDDQQIATLWPARSPRLFWARRQAHETAIHRVDVELAVGYGVSDFDPDFAADGLDELVMGMIPERRLSSERPITVVLEPLDANVSWTMTFAPAGVHVRRDAASEADLHVFGMSAELYRWAWNRAADDEVSLRGDLRLADWWRRTVQIGARPAHPRVD
jgi:uncharacterized protein (TIGR03083 family)